MEGASPISRTQNQTPISPEPFKKTENSNEEDLTTRQIEKVNSLIEEKLLNFSQNVETKISVLKDLSQKAFEEASRASIGMNAQVDLHQKASKRFREN